MGMKGVGAGVFALLPRASIGGVAPPKTRAVRQRNPATSSQPTTSADTDNIQEGDQTSPDTGTEATSEAGGQQVTETGGGSTAESDGPGGHEDPAGNVDHQFEGQE